MELRDLNELGHQLQNQFVAGFIADDVELPLYFKKNISGIGEYHFIYKKHMVHLTSSSINGYIPNSWFYIASYFVEYYKELKKYKDTLIDALTVLGMDNADKREPILTKYTKLLNTKLRNIDKKQRNQQTLPKCKNETTQEISEEVSKLLDNTDLSAQDKNYLVKFVSDYTWWYGGKTIDRADFYVSPILALANVVNASHSFIAELSRFLAEQPKAAAVLRHPNALYVENQLPSFFNKIFKFLYLNEDGLRAIFKYLVPGRAGSYRYAYVNGNMHQTNFFVKGEDNFNAVRKTDFDPYPYIYNGDKYFLSNELALKREGNKKNEVSFYGLKQVIESSYNNYKLYVESDIYIFTGDIMKQSNNLPLQRIYYGAPGTGKSNETKKLTGEGKDGVKFENNFTFRTTFHPDSDYSSFVGAYKPIWDDSKNRIIYDFRSQTFLKAYIEAWTHPYKNVALVIEEINRGNCAQIFGDIFQLLDREADGLSKYPIEADIDIQKKIKKSFDEAIEDGTNEHLIDRNNKTKIDKYYEKHYDDAFEKIKNGEILTLPENLSILATMNTSDQSLFPMDSAFKRRWEWVYQPIVDAHKGWKIKLDDNHELIDWWQFLDRINSVISELTTSEDKQLGYFFCSPDQFIEPDASLRAPNAELDLITANRFVNKVIFYLWNDVFKDYAFDAKCCKDIDGKEVLFAKFFTKDGKDININVLKQFFESLQDDKDKLVVTKVTSPSASAAPATPAPVDTTTSTSAVSVPQESATPTAPVDVSSGLADPMPTIPTGKATPVNPSTIDGNTSSDDPNNK